jgi:hypothetical protein
MLKWNLQTRILRCGVLIAFLYSFLSILNVSMYVFILSEFANITGPFVTFLFFDLSGVGQRTGRLSTRYQFSMPPGKGTPAY